MEFNERIKEFRRERGYSQEQIARKLHITQGAVSQWEKGITTPSAQQIALLADLSKAHASIHVNIRCT